MLEQETLPEWEISIGLETSHEHEPLFHRETWSLQLSSVEQEMFADMVTFY